MLKEGLSTDTTFDPPSVAAGPPWGSARELSLSPLSWRGEPPLLAPGRVTSLRNIPGVELILLRRRCYGVRVVLTIWERASTPPFTQEVLVAALFPPPPSPVVLVAWILERGEDVVRVRRRLWIRRSAATPTLGKDRLRPGGLATVIRQVSALLKPETVSYGLLAWPWFLTSPLLHQRVLRQYLYSLILCEDLPGRLQRLGTTPTPATAGPGRQDWRLRGARRRLVSDVKLAHFHHTVGYAPGTLGLGLA
jgi:hypothetical protein